MTLLYLAAAYMFGIALGYAASSAKIIDCSFPAWHWVIPLLLLPLCPFLNRIQALTGPPPPMRWPQRASFIPPRSQPSPAILAALTLCLLMGILRYASQPYNPCWQPSDLAYYNLPSESAFDRNAPQATITGYVAEYPLIQDTKQEVVVVAQSLSLDGAGYDVKGKMRLKTGIRTRYNYGQPLRLRGRLVTPNDFEDFSYRDYLRGKGVDSQFYASEIVPLVDPNQGNWLFRGLFSIRSRGEVLLNRLLPEPYAALANGMMLGIEAGIPDDLYEKFNLTGTSHVIVISGSNVSLIASVLMVFGFRLFGERRALYPALIGIGAYALLVGGDAAVLRAAFMGALFVIAISFKRRGTAVVSLAFACWVMTLLNPLTLWDAGFQLSSGATLGLILFSPSVLGLAKKLWPGLQGGILTAGPTQEFASDMGSGYANSVAKFCSGILQDGLFITIAANITTMPLVVYHFGRLSLVSFLSNLLISPVQEWIMLLGSAALVVGVLGIPLLSPWVAWFLLLVPWLSLVWTVKMVSWTAELPYASVEIASYGKVHLAVTYAVIFGWHYRDWIREKIAAVMVWNWQGWQRSVLGPAAFGGVGICATLVWIGLAGQPDGRLHLYFLDIGQGDGIFIETPSGRQVLIDGGSSPQQLFSQLGEVMPFWDREIDLMVLTHPDRDHMNAQIEVPKRFEIGQALETADNRQHPDAVVWRQALTSTGVDVQLQHTGGWIDLGDGVALWVLWPTAEGYVGENQDNENSLVLKLVYGDFSTLLTGDIGIPSERALLHSQDALASTVLKVGHHGSNGSTGAEFASAVNPSVAIIQVGENKYGHPHQEALEHLGGRLILRNDLHGRIHLSSDGQQMWIETERGKWQNEISMN